MDILKRITQLTDKAKDFPNAVIEYSFKLPTVKGIKPDNFFGVKAVFNKNVPSSAGANIIYKY